MHEMEMNAIVIRSSPTVISIQLQINNKSKSDRPITEYAVRNNLIKIVKKHIA